MNNHITTMNSKNLSPLASLIFGILVLSFLIGFYALAAWQEPTSTPPDGNIAAPVNVGPNAQTKQGDLNIMSKLGVGTTTPSEALEVVGGIKVSGNANICHLVYFDDIPPAENCPVGYYTWDAVAASSTGYMMCCKIDNPW